ncbi:hypothetical protein ScPMuIL_010058 [Solemya velum]
MASTSEVQDPDNPPNPRMRLSSEEMKVLRECNSESFYYRCIPFGLGLMGVTQYSVNRGYLAGHPRYGALFKNFGALLAGYILGKISYQSKCREKILALPDSQLAETLRRKKSGLELIPDTMALPDLSTSEKTKAQGDYKPSMDIDTDRRDLPKGLDDTYRPSIDRTVPVRKEEQSAEPSLTYEELRKKNRELSRGAPQQSSPSQDRTTFLPPPESSSPRPPPPPQRRPAFFTDKPQAKNQYGDVWDSES